MITLTIVDEFLSGDFIVYPSNYFNPNANALSQLNYSNSPGASAYGEGHTETFNLSAMSNGGVTYNWTIDNYNFSTLDKVTSFDGTEPAPQTSPTTSAVRLDVFNSTFTSDMDTYYVAAPGVIKKYPNMAITADDSSKLFQQIRMIPYESPTVVITPYDTALNVNSDNKLNATLTITHPTSSPVTNISGSFIWEVSTANWVDYVYQQTTDSSPDLSYTLAIGNGLTASSISQGGVNLINVSVTGTILDTINESPFDWVTKTVSFTPVTISSLVSAYALPEIQIYTLNSIELINRNIEFQNTSVQMPAGYLSGFLWDMGDDTIVFTDDYDSAYHIYTTPGTYTIKVSAVVEFDDSVTTKTFTNFITILSAYDSFNPDITRIYGVADIKFPYSLQEVEIPPNEWVTSDNVNAAFTKIQSNLSYLDGISKMYAQPPVRFDGWYGYTVANGTKWYGSSGNTFSDITTGGLLSAVNDVAVKDGLVYVANNTTVQILSSDEVGTLIAERDIKSIGDSFISLQSIAVDTDNRIYVLDKPKHRIAVLEYDATTIDGWKLLYSWGALGGATVKSKFQNPNDMILDSNNNVWVADTDNLVIKKFTRSGSWLATLESSYFNKNNKPLSLAIDDDGNVHVLTKKYIVKMKSDGTPITTYTYETGIYTPRKIIPTDGGGFLYIILSDKVVKVTKLGDPAGVFANSVGTVSFMGADHDEYKGFYIANGTSIIKYFDYINIVNTRLNAEASALSWATNDILIDPDEYVQDWVYNRSLSRLWDNIEIFRRSITGKIVTTTTDAGETTLELRSFTPTEYQASNNAVIDKSTIYIGMNEFVTADVVNRCLKYLYQNLENILELLS